MNDKTAVAPRAETFDLSPRSLAEAMQVADYLANSTIVPKDFQKNPGNILVAIQWGMELGLKPMQAMQNIAVINGRPSVWGDAVLALVLASPACKDVIETFDGAGAGRKAICIAQRHGRADVVSEFSMADAKTAGLSGKAGPWTQYPDRMLKMRARAFALRDQFADVLKGMPIAEEVMDYGAPLATEKPRTAAEIAAAARAPIEHTSERDQFIKDLEAAALLGTEPLKEKFAAIGAKGRKLVGAEEWERIKATVAPATAEAKVDEKKPEGKPADTSTPGPTFAQLFERLKAARDADEVASVLSDSAALPADQQTEIKVACETKAAEFGNG